MKNFCNTPLTFNCSNYAEERSDLCQKCLRELDCFNEAIFNATGKKLNQSNLSKEFEKLPYDIKLLSEKWGLCHSIFKNRVENFYSIKKIDLKEDPLKIQKDLRKEWDN